MRKSLCVSFSLWIKSNTNSDKMNSLQVLIFGLLFLTCQTIEIEDSDTDSFEEVESDPFYNPPGGDEDVALINTDTDSDFVPEGPPPSPAARFTRNSGVK